MVLAVPEMHLVLLASLQFPGWALCWPCWPCWPSLALLLLLLLVPCCLHWAQESSSLRVSTRLSER